MELKKATRKQVKLRLGLSAVAGGGKTKGALRLAYGMTKDWSKIAVIDTENKSASLYADMGEFLTLDLEAPYTPERYIEAIKTCENAGIEVCIIDSITHEWDGKGGCLEIQEKLGGRYQDWAKVTPRHMAFIDAILQSKMHVITSVRRKQDYEMTKDGQGKIKVEKAGLKEVTREGFEYELTLNLNIDINHLAKASKDRTGLFMDKPEFMITEETGEAIIKWCNAGEVPKAEEPDTMQIELYNQYSNLITESAHVLSPDDQKKYAKGADKWKVSSLTEAITKIKALIKEREDAILGKDHESKVNQSQTHNA